MSMIEEKEWDSRVFGYPVGVLSLKGSDDPAKLKQLIVESPYKLVYSFIHPEDKDNFSLVQANGLLVDTKVVYQKKLTSEESGAVQEVKSLKDYPKEEYYDRLLKLAFESGVYSRFRTDSNFTNQEFQKLYKIWLNKSLDQSIADHVWLREDEGFPTGFVTEKLKSNVLEIGLIAVDQKYRGLGIGSILLKQVEHNAFSKKAHFVEVATQKANKGACSFYERNGYSIKEEINIYHFWQR